MSDLDVTKPNDAKIIEVDGATVPFYEFEKDGFRYIEFDSSTCVPPEPMVNAMLAIGLIKDAKTKVIMINHRSPMGLFPKIQDNFNIEEKGLEDGRAKLVFSYKQGLSEKADLSDKSCH